MSRGTVVVTTRIALKLAHFRSLDIVLITTDNIPTVQKWHKRKSGGVISIEEGQVHHKD